MDTKMSLFLDCGAPSLYNALIRKGGKDRGVHAGSYFKDRKDDDFSFIETDEYKDYRKNYAEFIKKHQKEIDTYSNLDVINNPEATWENQQYLEEKGLKPIPVFHLGCDEKWLRMYLEKDYDYIALGGITPNPPQIVSPILDNLWNDFLTNSEGYPIVKVHGFAVTSLRLMIRYPWYSVDSTSWVMTGRFGNVYVPRKNQGEYIYDKNSLKVCVSTRSPKKDAGEHIDSFSPKQKQSILDYFKEKGYELGKSEFKMVDKDYKLQENESWFGKANKDGKREVEVFIESGLCNDYRKRDELNIIYFLDVEKNLPKWPWPFKKTKKKKGLGLI